jgi:hypothetical protein
MEFFATSLGLDFLQKRACMQNEKQFHVLDFLGKGNLLQDLSFFARLPADTPWPDEIQFLLKGEE